MNEETSLIAFKAICNFVNDLSSVYGHKHKPLKLYKRLINQTQISHNEAIKKHLSAFHHFCVENREALYAQNRDTLTVFKIEYSNRVYIDMGLILKNSDTETCSVIWRHLLTISALLDPAGKAKEVLRKNAEEGKTGENESDFLANIISKVEKNVNPNANPMEAISSIMQSGIFNDLLSGMQGGLSSGKLDLSKLMGAVQGMVSSLGEQAGNDPESKQALSMVSNMSSMLENTGKGGPPPDMMKMMNSLMGGLNSAPKIEEVPDSK